MHPKLISIIYRHTYSKNFAKIENCAELAKFGTFHKTLAVKLFRNIGDIY